MILSEPTKKVPDSKWEHYTLYKRVKEAIYGLPLYFRTETNIEGISATDIFTLNSALGATIEFQVVETLNNMGSPYKAMQVYKHASVTLCNQLKLRLRHQKTRSVTC